MRLTGDAEGETTLLGHVEVELSELLNHGQSSQTFPALTLSDSTGAGRGASLEAEVLLLDFKDPGVALLSSPRAQRPSDPDDLERLSREELIGRIRALEAVRVPKEDPKTPPRLFRTSTFVKRKRENCDGAHSSPEARYRLALSVLLTDAVERNRSDLLAQVEAVLNGQKPRNSTKR